MLRKNPDSWKKELELSTNYSVRSLQHLSLCRLLFFLEFIFKEHLLKVNHCDAVTSMAHWPHTPGQMRIMTLCSPHKHLMKVDYVPDAGETDMLEKTIYFFSGPYVKFLNLLLTSGTGYGGSQQGKW